MARVSSLPRVVRVAEDSPASRAGLLVGDEIVAVDGLAPRDLIEWRFATDAADPSITFIREGSSRKPTWSKPMEPHSGGGRLRGVRPSADLRQPL